MLSVHKAAQHTRLSAEGEWLYSGIASPAPVCMCVGVCASLCMSTASACVSAVTGVLYTPACKGV